MGRRIVELQNSGVAWWAVLFTLPLALASIGLLRYYTSAEVLDIEFSILFVLLTFILSIVSYYGVERVFRSKSTNKKQALSWGLLVFGVLGASQTMAKVNAMFTPVALPLEYLRYGDDSQIAMGI